MNIYVSKDGQQHGPFTFEEISHGLRDGYFSVSDYAWREGMADWIPLSSLFQTTTVDVGLPKRTTASTETATKKRIFPSKPFIICSAVLLLVLVAVLAVCVFGHENPTQKIERFAKGIKNVDGISVSDLSYDVKRTDSTVTKFVSIIKGTVSTDDSTALFIFQANYQDGKWVPASEGVEVELTGGKEYNELQNQIVNVNSLDRQLNTQGGSDGVKKWFKKKSRIGLKLDAMLRKNMAEFQ